MNKAEILKLFLKRKSIKRIITENYQITLDKSDKVPRNEVFTLILDKLELTRNNSNIKEITEVLESMGLERGIYSGRKNWRGLRS
jgi:hypothetical protein